MAGLARNTLSKLAADFFFNCYQLTYIVVHPQCLLRVRKDRQLLSKHNTEIYKLSHSTCQRMNFCLVSLHVCVYICMYTSTYVCTMYCTSVCTYEPTCMCVSMCACLYVCVCIVYICMHICMYICMYVCMRVCAECQQQSTGTSGNKRPLGYKLGKNRPHGNKRNNW